jgi:aspartate dehydrogenase
MDAAPLRIGFIGDGGISRSVRAALAERAPRDFETVALLTRRPDEATGPVVENLDALLASGTDVILECASHEAVADFGETVLQRGVPLIITSIGALSDATLHRRLEAAAQRGKSRLILTPGAIGGIDALAAARVGGLTRVCYRGSKPALAWKGTPAEQLLSLDKLATPVTFYRGNAGEAARAYPKNSNVAATVALAGIGFERTEVELVADPTIAHNVHELWFEGADGRFEVRIVGVPSPDNPKTSLLTAHSLVRLLTSMRGPVVI